MMHLILNLGTMNHAKISDLVLKNPKKIIETVILDLVYSVLF